MLNIICSAQGLNIENERFSAGLNNPINHKIWSCSWSTCSKNMLQLGQITQAIHTQHTAKVDNMFVCDGTVSLSSASDLSVFLIFFLPRQWYLQHCGKKPGHAFFPSTFMESERKVVKPGASSYLAFQTLRWTWSRKMSQKRYNTDLEPCGSQCSGSPEETPLLRQENWWDERSQWRNDKFCQTMSNNNWENLFCTREK